MEMIPKQNCDSDWISFHVWNRSPQSSSIRTSQSLPNWQTMPELPTADELLSTKPKILPRAHGRPGSKMSHLEAHYAMCRMEGIETIRRAIAIYRDNPMSRDSAHHLVYTKVHVRGYQCTKMGAACRVAFSMERSPDEIDWARSSRLTPGALLALTPREDGFKTICTVATVADRIVVGGLQPDVENGEDANTPPRIDIFWARPEDAIVDPNKEMIMIEAPTGYFEAMRHVMLGLQHSASLKSKFDPYIFDGRLSEQNISSLRVVDRSALSKSFDESQTEAFDRITSRELAIVQGPPGTGKTFTSVVAIESFVNSPNKVVEQTQAFAPIIVAAQTNHAVDQLLLACTSLFGARIARVGGRCESDVINEKSMYNLRQRSNLKAADGESKRAWKMAQKRIKDYLGTCFPHQNLITAHTFLLEEIITLEQYTSLLAASNIFGHDKEEPMELWLGQHGIKDRPFGGLTGERGSASVSSENADELKVSVQGSNDQIDDIKGGYIPIACYRSNMGRNSNIGHLQAEKYLSKYSDLYEIKPPRRGIVYRYLCQRLAEKLAGGFQTLLEDYQDKCCGLKIQRWKHNVRVLQQERVQIIGCTTTGLSKYRGLLTAMKPKILVIEEAAETLEANILSALFPGLDQLVLIGDHQQLTPHVTVRELTSAYCNFNVSLFQRLIQLGMPYSMLHVQHRMIPSIRKIVQVFYPRLRDHPATKQLSPVPGMGGHNLWWFQHQWPEYRNSNQSYFNFKEARMIVGFVRYLLQNGVLAKEITVLSFYQGQIEVIEKLIGKHERDLSNPHMDISIRTVDSFQGEENEIIILSLVRSNPDTPTSGFIGSENRAVVALSRAKRGLFVFGDAENVLESDPESVKTWAKVFRAFILQSRTNFVLPVTCQVHGRTTNIGVSEDWEKIPHGGCRFQCIQKCRNGHQCQYACHPYRRMCQCLYSCDMPSASSMKIKGDGPIKAEMKMIGAIKTLPPHSSFHTFEELEGDNGFRSRFCTAFRAENGDEIFPQANNGLGPNSVSITTLMSRTARSNNNALEAKVTVNETFRPTTVSDGHRAVGRAIQSRYVMNSGIRPLQNDLISLETLEVDVESSGESLPSYATSDSNGEFLGFTSTEEEDITPQIADSGVVTSWEDFNLILEE